MGIHQYFTMISALVCGKCSVQAKLLAIYFHNMLYLSQINQLNEHTLVIILAIILKSHSTFKKPQNLTMNTIYNSYISLVEAFKWVVIQEMIKLMTTNKSGKFWPLFHSPCPKCLKQLIGTEKQISVHCSSTHSLGAPLIHSLILNYLCFPCGLTFQI